MLCSYIRSFERQNTGAPSRSALPKSLATWPHLNCRYDEFSAPTSKGKYESTFCPTLPPSKHPTISRLTPPPPNHPHPHPQFFLFFIPFYKSELVALEKWVWKFEMHHHYVVKFLDLSLSLSFFKSLFSFLFVFLPLGFLLAVLRALWSVWSVKMRKPLIFTMRAGNISFFFHPQFQAKTPQFFFPPLAVCQTRVYSDTEEGLDLGTAVKRYAKNWYTKILNEVSMQMCLFNDTQ